MPKYIGRPRKYETAEEMQEIIDEYLQECSDEGVYPTVSMLAYRLDMSRRDLLNYENCLENGRLKQCSQEQKEAFVHTVKKAKQYIEGCYDNRLINGNGNPVGTIFSLKNNYNWVDKTEVEQTNREIHISLEE